MDIFPTKGNLINLKKSLALARLGYTLLDRKRNILIRETMSLISAATEIQSLIDVTYSKAYLSLQNANITLGVIDHMAAAVPVDDGLSIDFKSVMGVEIPLVALDSNAPRPYYGYARTNAMLDDATIKFDEVKHLTARLAQVENSVYRLAQAIKKTQKRANALKNIVIPKFESQVKFITEALEEKEREEFSRLKVIKNRSVK